MTLLLLPGVAILAWNIVIQMDVAGRGLPRVNAKVMGPTAVLNAGLNLVMIPSFGGDGAAASSLISYSLATIWSMYVYGKLTRQPMRRLLLARPRLSWE